MNIFNSPSNKTKTSLVASVLILSVLAGVLSACTIPVVTPTSIGEVGAELTAAQETPASPEATLASPIEVATELPTLTSTPELTITQTPEPTLTPTQEITFDIPDAPPNVDPEKWKEAYLSALQSNPYLKLKIEAVLVKPYWDQSMNTFIWDLGGERFGYNSEFNFTGDVVKDMYGNGWVVRKKLTQSQGDACSIWEYDKLHEVNKDNLVMGVQCTESLYGETCAFVGQFIKKETTDMKPFLVSNFDSMSIEEKGEMYKDIKNFNTEFLVVRIPNESGYSEIKFPVCPLDYCNLNMVTLSINDSVAISGTQLFNRITEGQMLYLHIGVMGDYFPGIDWKDVVEKATKNKDNFATWYFFNSYGMVESLRKVVNKEFKINLRSDFVANHDETKAIYDIDKLAEEKIIQPADSYLIR